jgi:hypothetical protein
LEGARYTVWWQGSIVAIWPLVGSSAAEQRFCKLQLAEPKNISVALNGRAYTEPSVFCSLAKCLKLLARSKGFEPLTPRFEVWCSIQLSYERGGRTLVHDPEKSMSPGIAAQRYGK